MINKKFNLTLGALACSIAMAHGAASVFTTFDENGNYTTVVDTSNALIPSGSGNVSLGRFMTLSGDQLASATLAQLVADFVPYSTGMFGGDPVLNSDGGFAVSSDAPIVPAFTGQAAYLVMGNGLTLATSSQYAIVEDGVFPADPAPFLTAFDGDLPTLYGTGIIRVGALVPIVESSLTGEGLVPVANSLQLIPEPSSLALLGLVGLLAFRRRR